MRHKTLIQSLVMLCAIALLGCNKSATSPDSVASSGGDTATTGNTVTAESSGGQSTAGSSSALVLPAAPASASAPKPIVVHAGTTIVVTADQTVSSKTNNSGDHFEASLAEPVVVGDKVVIPKGAKATGTVTDSKSAGKFKGNAEITVALSSVTVKGQKYRVTTSEVTQAGKGRGKRTAEGAGGGAVVGGLIGALAGHGKGAAIGAAAGAGAGTAGTAMTGERDITINPETKLSFKLKEAIAIERQ